MRKYHHKKWLGVLTAAALSVTILSGCTDESLEKQLSYRAIGINSMQAGDYEGAITAFESALEQHVGKITETEIDICYYKAAAQYLSGNIEGALEIYEDLLDYNEKDGKAYYMRGCILLQQGKNEQALADFSDAVKYNQEDYELYVNIYENLAAYNLAPDGETYLKKAFDIKGDNAEQLAWRGKIYLMLGEYENATAELTAALQKESVTANLYLAQVYDAQGDTANAQKYYQAYVDAGEADSVAMNALAEIEMAKGNYTGALEYINQGLAMEEIPNKKALLQNQMIACEYTGDFATAWAAAQEYMAAYPDDMTVQREYVFLKSRQGVLEETVTVPETEEVPQAETDTTETESVAQ